MRVLETIIVFAGLLAIAFAANATWGTKYSNSVLVSTQNVTARASANNYQTVNVNFPVNGQVNNKIISFINVTDRFTNTSGAAATLWSGGPGYTFATINLKSQLSQGINSTVQIWVQN